MKEDEKEEGGRSVERRGVFSCRERAEGRSRAKTFFALFFSLSWVLDAVDTAGGRQAPVARLVRATRFA